MKLSPEVLAEVIDIFRDGLTTGRDMSERLRSLELSEDESTKTIVFSADWLRSNRRILND